MIKSLDSFIKEIKGIAGATVLGNGTVTLVELDEQGYNLIILDFTNTIMIDSAGLGRILRFHQDIRNHGGELKITNISSDYISKMFKVLKLGKVIKIEGF